MVFAGFVFSLIILWRSHYFYFFFLSFSFLSLWLLWITHAAERSGASECLLALASKFLSEKREGACEKVRKSVTQRAAFPTKTLDKIKYVCTLIVLLVLWGFPRQKTPNRHRRNRFNTGYGSRLRGMDVAKASLRQEAIADA